MCARGRAVLPRFPETPLRQDSLLGALHLFLSILEDQIQADSFGMKVPSLGPSIQEVKSGEAVVPIKPPETGAGDIYSSLPMTALTKLLPWNGSSLGYLLSHHRVRHQWRAWQELSTQGSWPGMLNNSFLE